MLSELFAVVVIVVSADTVPVVLAGAPAPLSPASLSPAAAAMAKPRTYTADSLVLDKSDRVLTLFEHGRVVQTFSVALGKNPVGPKLRRGDGRTPEGLYFIEGRNPSSKYHLALQISYPNATDRARAAQRGVAPGGDIMIHGLPRQAASIGALHRQQDWTEGCVALTNDEIEELWRSVPVGARILIKP